MALGVSRVTNGDGLEATMEDIGEKGKPPGRPSDGTCSWVKKVMGSLGGGMPILEEVVDEEFVTTRLQLEFSDGEDGELVVTIGKEVLEAMNSLWKKCMIVKVLGRKIPTAILNKRLRELWKPNGGIFVMDLLPQFFLVRFESEEDYLVALVGGPWRVFGSHLMVQA